MFSLPAGLLGGVVGGLVEGSVSGGLQFMVFFVLFFYYLMMVSALVSIRIKSVWQSSGGRAIFTSYAILAAPAVGTATGESFFCVFVFLALFIDLVTDKVQPLSRFVQFCGTE